MRNKLILCLIINSLILIAHGPAFSGDEIVAIVNKDIITKSDVDAFINFMRIQLLSEYDEEELEKRIDSMKTDLLEKLIEDKLILQEAKKLKISIEPYRIKAKIDEILKNYGSEKDFQAALSRDGLVRADLESKINEQFLMQAVITRQIKNKITVSPSEITLFYEQNPQLFKTPEVRHYSYLTFEDLNSASDIYNLLKKGQGIDSIAQKYSLSINKTSIKEGEQLKQEIDMAVSKLAEGGLSVPFRMHDKYFIFSLDKVTPSILKSLSESQGSIQAYIFDRKMQEGLLDWIEQLRKKSYIKIMQN